MGRFVVRDGIKDVREYAGNRGRTHHVIALIFLSESFQLRILTRRKIWCDAILINLRVLRQPVVVLEKILVHFNDLGRGIDPWLLYKDVQTVLQLRDRVEILEVIFDVFDNVVMHVNWLPYCRVVHIHAVIPFDEFFHCRGLTLPQSLPRCPEGLFVSVV